MAVRLSIGAEPLAARARNCCTESCVLAVLGGVAGLLVARWTLDLIASLMENFVGTTLSKLHANTVLVTIGKITITPPRAPAITPRGISTATSGLGFAKITRY